MSSERAEFRPIEAAGTRRALPYAVAGVLIVVAGLAFIARRNVAVSDVRPVGASNVASKPVVAAAVPPSIVGANSDQANADASKVAAAKAPEGPNVLGGAVAAAGKLATVARAELDRELARTQGAQKQAAAYRKQVDDLTKQLTEARGQIAAMQKARQPPPPSDQEQILQMLVPVLRNAIDGRP
jgi:hypothetical protein